MSLEDLNNALEKGLPYKSDIKDRISLTPETELILSQPLCFQKDDIDTLEWRTWIVNSEIGVITRYAHPEIIFPIPDSVTAFAVQFAGMHKGILPKHYVLDIGQTTDRDEVVVKLNSIVESECTNREMFKDIARAYISS